MAKVYDYVDAMALLEGDYVRILEKDVLVTEVIDTGPHILVRGLCYNAPDVEFEAEVDPFFEVPLLTE